MDEEWEIRREEDDGWQEQVIRANLGPIEAAYRRAVLWGYRPPAVAVRFDGDIEASGHAPGVIKAVNIDDLDAIVARYGEDAGPFKAAIRSVPAGTFPVLVFDEGPGPTAIRAVQVPDRS